MQGISEMFERHLASVTSKYPNYPKVSPFIKAKAWTSRFRLWIWKIISIPTLKEKNSPLIPPLTQKRKKCINNFFCIKERVLVVSVQNFRETMNWHRLSQVERPRKIESPNCEKSPYWSIPHDSDSIIQQHNTECPNFHLLFGFFKRFL